MTNSAKRFIHRPNHAGKGELNRRRQGLTLSILQHGDGKREGLFSGKARQALERIDLLKTPKGPGGSADSVLKN